MIVALIAREKFQPRHRNTGTRFDLCLSPPACHACHLKAAVIPNEVRDLLLFLRLFLGAPISRLADLLCLCGCPTLAIFQGWIFLGICRLEGPSPISRRYNRRLHTRLLRQGKGTEPGARTDVAARRPAVDPATTTQITGTVILDGPPPAPTTVDMSSEPACAKPNPAPHPRAKSSPAQTAPSPTWSSS